MKKVLIGLIAIIGLFIIISLFLSREVKMESSIVVNGSMENTFAQVNNLKNWPEWSAWDQIDPDIKHEFPGTTEGEGAIREWYSKHDHVGNGSMTITASKPGEMVAIDLNFMENGTAKTEYWFEETEEGIKVTSKFDSEMPPIIGPWIKMMMMPELEANTQKSLEQMKARVEAMPEKPAIEVTEVETSEMWYVGITDTITMAEMEGIHEQLYGELFQIDSLKSKIAGQPIAIWHIWKPEENMIVMEAGIPVSDTSLTMVGRAHIGNVPAGKAVMASHWGWYDSLGETHEGINAYMKENSMNDAGARWEVYVTDPMTEKDTSKIETQIYVPI